MTRQRVIFLLIVGLITTGTTSIAEAAALADAIRMKFEAQRHLKVEPGHSPTASFGVAAFTPDTATEATIAAADRALYRAKRSGRNRVEIDAPTTGSGPAWRAA